MHIGVWSEQDMTSPVASVMKIWFPVERDIALIIMLSSQLFIESF